MKTKLTLLLPFVLMMNLLESHPGRTDELGGHKEGMLGKYHIHHNNDPIFTRELFDMIDSFYLSVNNDK